MLKILLSLIITGSLSCAAKVQRITIERLIGDPVVFEVEVAKTPQEKEQGLQYRSVLAQDHGMLFVYDKPQYVHFWMKNTKIPLDLIFIDANGVINQVVTRDDCGSLKETHSSAPIMAVLEINAYQDIDVGDGVDDLPSTT